MRHPDDDEPDTAAPGPSEGDEGGVSGEDHNTLDERTDDSGDGDQLDPIPDA